MCFSYFSVFVRTSLISGWTLPLISRTFAFITECIQSTFPQLSVSGATTIVCIMSSTPLCTTFSFLVSCLVFFVCFCSPFLPPSSLALSRSSCYVFLYLFHVCVFYSPVSFYVSYLFHVLLCFLLFVFQETRQIRDALLCQFQTYYTPHCFLIVHNGTTY